MEKEKQNKINPLLMLGLVKKLKKTKDTPPIKSKTVKEIIQKQRREISLFLKENKPTGKTRLKIGKTMSTGTNRTNRFMIDNLFNNKSKLYMSGVMNSNPYSLLPKIYNSASKNPIARKNQTFRKINDTDRFKEKMLYGKSMFSLKSERSGRIRDTYLIEPKPKTISIYDVPKSLLKLYNNRKKIFNQQPMDTKVYAEIYKHNDDLIMIGGFGITFSDEMIIYNKKYNKPLIKYDEKFSRIRFASIGIDNMFIVHGGEVSNNFVSNKILNDLLLFDVKRVEVHNFKTKNKGCLPFKKGHIMFLIGSDLYFEGGLKYHNRPDKDIYAYNLTTRKIREVRTEKKRKWVYFHKCCTVDQTTNPDSLKHLLRKNTLNINKRLFNSIKRKTKSFNRTITKAEVYNNQKIFCFGGLNEENVSSDLLYVYHVEEEELIVDYPEIYGRRPQGRYDHQMCYIDDLKSVVLLGGKHKSSEGIEYVLNDLWLLQVEKLLWIRVNIEFEGRYGFSMTQDNGNLLIFGGYGKANLIDGYVRYIEINKSLLNEFQKFFNNYK